MQLEWCKLNSDGMGICPYCFEGRKYGHKIDCELKFQLDAVEELLKSVNETEMREFLAE